MRSFPDVTSWRRSVLTFGGTGQVHSLVVALKWLEMRKARLPAK